MKSLQGHLLVASPHLRDSPFCQAVILIVQQDRMGAVGVILNRPTQESVRTLWNQVSDTPCASNRPIYIGGPVSGPLMALHDHKSLAEMETANGLYVAATRQCLEQLMGQTSHPFRLFVGHAGWSSRQLERELTSGMWLTVPASHEHVFGQHQDLWRTLVGQIGKSVLLSTLKIKHIPDDPSWN